MRSNHRQTTSLKHAMLSINIGGLLRKTARKGKSITSRVAEGVTFVEMNNDGYLNVVLSSHGGYLRFLHSTQPNKRNNFMVFELKGTTSNQYGIGAMLIFTASSIPDQ
jgi:hypothetical protein